MWIKLKENEVREIKVMALSGRYSLREIAERFGITHTNVRFIRLGITWKHLWIDDATTETEIAAGVTASVE